MIFVKLIVCVEKERPMSLGVIATVTVTPVDLGERQIGLQEAKVRLSGIEEEL
jgi:hypothetical protein